MDEQTVKNLKEASNIIGITWAGLTISAGMNAGLFDELSDSNPMSVNEIAEKFEYDPEKLEKWFYYAESLGIVIKENASYKLTSKGILLTNKSPYKDLLGLYNLNNYFMQSAVNSRENFQRNKSQDTLTKGRISNEYQGKVSDNLSVMLLEVFKKHNVGQNDTLLDFGCGNGNLLRALVKALPLMQFMGVDMNLNAIEKGIQENLVQGIADKIKLLNCDVMKDMSTFADHSYDWVTGINIFHFIPQESRKPVVNNMIRLCKKGVFFTEAIIEASLVTAGANPMMSLLWNDFTGFFKKEDVKRFNEELQIQYPGFNLQTTPIIQGTSYLVAMVKKPE